MVTGVTNDTTAAAAAMKKSTGMNKDDFLKLFITQLQNQDPLKPQDSSQFIAQLAQLTQVEQAYNTNTNLQSLLSAMNGASNLSAVSFIGKAIKADSDQLNLTAGSAATVGYRLPANASQVQVGIADATGKTVRTITLGATAAGDGSLAWDGRDSSGNSLPSGSYTVTVTGINSDGTQFSGSPLLLGKVDGVTLEGSEPSITVSGISVPISKILSVKG
ncbi:flagellar hook assembly protein FlgD [Geobacter pickeringii]|uniref:Basal-body rod modification protein FlgD n=1 Tax=Geobacter pickeringii TaxID=345632 RepID=A0A0B5BD04_9BACT|nr:FlgD immunoglobulin-like domain containing protein [Geobacter pickeringii]AJE04347.1 flagellar hook capping protein [Geobacter pickeringii]